MKDTKRKIINIPDLFQVESFPGGFIQLIRWIYSAFHLDTWIRSQGKRIRSPGYKSSFPGIQLSRYPALFQEPNIVKYITKRSNSEGMHKQHEFLDRSGNYARLQWEYFQTAMENIFNCNRNFKYFDNNYSILSLSFNVVFTWVCIIVVN